MKQKKPNPVYRIVHFIARCAWRLFGSWEVIDYQKVPATGGAIAVGNHVSYVDPPLIGAAIQRECRFMARHDLWQNRILRWLLPRVGAFPIERGKPDRTALKFALDSIAQGLILAMFPEGTRSQDGRLQPAEPGIALIVRRSGVPVIPVAVIGTDKMMPRGGGMHRAKLKVVFGDPIFFTPDAGKEEICVGIMRAIAALLTAHGVPSVAAEDRQDEAAQVTA